MAKAVISLSGGLDSTCLLMHLLASGYTEIRAYSFDYGQKHSIELKKVKRNIAFLQSKGYNVQHQVINVRDVFSDSASSLHRGGADIPEGHYADENMKSTVVENRNIIFSAIIYGKALGWANKSGDNVVITLGIHAGDHCFTRDTKILTPKGYKTIDELKIGDPVYSVNENNEIEIDTVSDAVKVATVDEIHKISTTTGSLKVTGDHKIYKLKFSDFDPSKGYKKELVQINAKDISIGDYLLTSNNLHNIWDTRPDLPIDLSSIIDDSNVLADKDSIYINENNKCPRFIDAKYIIQLMAWYITEGWTSKSTRKGASKYSSSFSQSLWKNFENCESLQQLFTESGIPVRYQYSKIIENGMPKEITYYFSGAISALLQSAGRYSAEKQIPQWLFDLLVQNPHYLNLFITTMIAGDGHYNEMNGLNSYISKSHKLIEQLSFLIKLTNNYVKIHKNKASNYILQFGNFNRKSGLVLFGDGALTKVTNIELEHKTEDVFDITVEKNHNFFAGELGNILVHNCIYPDCRPESHEAARHLYKISNWNSEAVDYIAPFENIDKGEVLGAGIRAMEVLGFTKAEIKRVLRNTHTCYSPDEVGRSCGKCGSCTERLEAFENQGLTDPIPYQD